MPKIALELTPEYGEWPWLMPAPPQMLQRATTRPKPHLDPQDDLALVRRAHGGDHAACEAVIDRLRELPAMIRIKNVRLGSPLSSHELEDVLQGVLIALWQKLDRFDARVPLLHWAYGFGVVEIRRSIERRGRRREQSATELDLPAVAAAESNHFDREVVHRELCRLDDPEHEVVMLKHFESMTFDEMAVRLGISSNTAKTRYYRGLERLRARLLPHVEGDGK